MSAAPLSAESPGNLGSSVDALLAAFGVERAGTRLAVEDVVAEELTVRSHEARMVELRYGVLTLAASQVGAQLLRFDQDNLLAALQERIPGVVQELKIRVESPRR